MKLKQLVLICSIVCISFHAHSQEVRPLSANQSEADTNIEAKVEAEEEEEDTSAREDEAAMNEDPEAQRRSILEEQPELQDTWPKIDFYGSVRLHAINHFDENGDHTELDLGDGASRFGMRGEWGIANDWSLFGRIETGFDVLDSFTAKGTTEDNKGGLEERLLYGGIDSKKLTATWGKNWSAYYKIAGMADRFSIFGGQASGVYNARTDGGATGTGRADDVLQIKLYTSSLKAIRIKPFNLTLQFQEGQPIPHVKDRHYGKAWGASAWLETQSDIGIGIAYHQAEINNPDDPLITQAGISGDARAIATSFRWFGERWYSALVLTRLENIETTDTLKYIEGYGAELYTQWEFKDRWWMVAGGNWLNPDNNDEDAEKYEVKFGVLGLRYTFDSFQRMIYAEYRWDFGNLADGSEAKNEFTIGIRWDFGY